MTFTMHDHRTCSTFKEVPDSAVAKVSCIFEIKRDRTGRPQFIPDVLVHYGNVYAQRIKCVQHKIFQHPPKLDFGKPGPAGFIFFQMLIAGEFLIVEFLRKAFGKYDYTVIYAGGESFYYGTHKHIGDLLKREFFLLEFFRDKCYCRTGSLSDAERKMPGMPAHCGDKIPSARGLCVFHYIRDNINSHVPRSLIAERRKTPRQRNIVINSFGDMYNLHGTPRFPLNPVSHKKRALTADRNKILDAELFEGGHQYFEFLLNFIREFPGSPQNRAALCMYPGDVIYSEWQSAVGIALKKGFEATLYPDDRFALINSLDSGRTDDGVDAGGWASTYNDSDYVMAFSMHHIKYAF